MTESQSMPLLLIASNQELSWSRPAWGTGGWIAPEQREALDWLTLARLMGWGVTLASTVDLLANAKGHHAHRWIVIGLDPESCNDELVNRLASWLAAEPLLVLSRASEQDNQLARLAGTRLTPQTIRGRSLSWTGSGPEKTWQCRNPIELHRLDPPADGEVWARLDGVPIVTARRVGRGMIATLGFHPSRARDTEGVMTALLKHLLIWGSLRPVAWLDFKGTMVLRMDDPGGSQNVYNRSFYYPKLSEAQWAAIGKELRKRQARLSMAYISGWVDDGDAQRGTLRWNGRAPSRVPGKVYPSPEVIYHDRDGHKPGTVHDYEAEFRGIETLRSSGLGDVELHGHTHIHPDRMRWLAAEDRYETWPATSWYRELGEPAAKALASLPPDQHPLVLGMDAITRHFGVQPTTLIPPGDQWTSEVLEVALDLGLVQVDSYYLAIRDKDRFCWCTHVCSPYLDKPEADWFDSELPVVGYFHDYEPAVYGLDWMTRWLDRWEESGAQKFFDFRELAATIGRQYFLQDDDDSFSLKISGGLAPALVRPVTLFIRAPQHRLPSALIATIDRVDHSLPIEDLGDSVGRVVVPVSSSP